MACNLCSSSSSLSSLLVLLTSKTISLWGSTRRKFRHSNVRWPAEQNKNLERNSAKLPNSIKRALELLSFDKRKKARLGFNQWIRHKSGYFENASKNFEKLCNLIPFHLMMLYDLSHISVKDFDQILLPISSVVSDSSWINCLKAGSETL